MTGEIETYRGAVYPWETDVLGHMNVRFYVSKFDEGTWQLMAHVGCDPAAVRERGTGFMAVDQHIAYRKELRPGDTIYVKTAMMEVGEKKFRFRHRMYHALNDTLIAEMQLIGVHVDLASRRAVPISDETRARAEALLVPEDGAAK